MTDYYFVIRTDVSADSGIQRCFGGAFESEADAAHYAVDRAGKSIGTFAVVGPARIVLDIVPQGGPQPIVAVPREAR